MAEDPALERLLRRDRSITIVGLILLCALAWLYILAGAGLGMSAWEMTRLSLMPHDAAPGMPGMAHSPAPAWDVVTVATMVTMWWLMMVAMMAPSAAPTILLYARVHRHSATGERTADGLAPTGAFAAGYLLAWLGFSLAAGALHWALQLSGLVAIATMGSQSRWLSALILVATGLYQLSPLKRRCLAHCRAPAAFLSRHWRSGTLGALRLGALHGAFCLGCCWLLMALLFVGGVMNLAWIALLTLLVLTEKLVPRGRRIGLAVGVALIAWGVAIVLA
jgi:predicted metal-binding membrane protein